MALLLMIYTSKDSYYNYGYNYNYSSKYYNKTESNV